MPNTTTPYTDRDRKYFSEPTDDELRLAKSERLDEIKVEIDGVLAELENESSCDELDADKMWSLFELGASWAKEYEGVERNGI